MARIRTIKPDVAQSEALANIPRAALYTWVSLWPHCDDHGYHLANPRLIWAAIYPLRSDTSPDDVAADLELLEQTDRICRFTGCDGKEYLHVLGWEEHQRLDNAGKSRTAQCPRHHPDRPCPLHAANCPGAAGGDSRPTRGDSRRTAASRGSDLGTRTTDLGPRTVPSAPNGASALTPGATQTVQDHGPVAGSTRAGPILGEVVAPLTAADLVGAYVDTSTAIGVAPIPRDKARVGRDCKELLAAGKAPELIAAALARMVAKGRPVAALVGLVGEVERERAGYPVPNPRAPARGDLEAITARLRGRDSREDCGER